MNPLEAAIRAVARELGADPDTWRGFEQIGRVAVEALIETLPPQLGADLKAHLFPASAS